jgi:hypothetical protein
MAYNKLSCCYSLLVLYTKLIKAITLSRCLNEASSWADSGGTVPPFSQIVGWNPCQFSDNFLPLHVLCVDL